MKLLFSGDVNFRGIDPLSEKKSEELLLDVLPYIRTADYRIVNLETPLAVLENHVPIEKSGPNLISSPQNIAFLKKFHADGVTLANNHIGDFGEGAVKDTLELLKENNILYAGAGADIEEAYQAMYFEKDGVRASVISVCENEFGMATESRYGSAGYEPRLLLRQIRKEKEKADYVIVVFHGGNEFNPLPSPDTVNRYRLICDMGADAVIAGHTHCPQGYENYEGKPIVYSMGNLLFQNVKRTDPHDSWYYGYLSVLELREKIELQIIPYRFDKEATIITVFAGTERELMLSYIQNLSDIIQDKNELERYFKGWAWGHKWITVPPSDFNKTEGYNVCGNLNLLFCEAHLSQSKAIFHTLYQRENTIATQYEEKIRLLQIMPV